MLTTLPLRMIRYQVEVFLTYADQNPDLHFQLTPIGCGLAGYTPKQIAPFFDAASTNILIPDDFKPFLARKDASNG